MMTEDFKAALDRFMEGAQKIMDDYHTANYPDSPTRSVIFQDTGARKYLRIVETRYFKATNERDESYGSAWAFIDLGNGDVLKSAGWKTPARHARGNILDEHNGLKYIESTGPMYLR